MSEPRAKLIYEWDLGKRRYRLLSRGKWSAGYSDSYDIEELGTDGLGEPRWDRLFTFKGGEEGRMSPEVMLARLVEQILNKPLLKPVV